MRLVLKNIDGVLTGAKKIIVLSSSIIVLSLLNIILSSYSDFASALTYSNPGQVSFTFNPTLSLSLSSSNIVISNLSPNTTSDSNIVIINISTNIAYGYTLTASVGNAGNATTNLTNTANSSNTFTSLATTDSLASMNSADASSNGKWGYSFSTDSGTTWSNYSGLPLYTDTANYAELINTTSAADSRLISFKIGAKSSNLQASGTYTNTINFYLTSNPVPVTLEQSYALNGKTKLNGYYKLQDMNADICEDTEVYDEGSFMQAIDTRDNKIYWITKYQDDNCWMAQNLDLDLDSSTTYTNQNTDIGYNTSTGTYGTASWTPTNNTIATADADDWVGSNTVLYSYDPGNYYWNGTESNSNDWSAYYNGCSWNTTLDKYENCNESLNPITTYVTSIGDSRYHLGNYYNWTAATAMNDSSSVTSSDITVEQSICPTGWTLPRVGTGDNSFYALWNEYSLASNSYNDSNSNNQHDSNEDALWTNPLFFTASGDFDGRLFDVGSSGGFWSSVTSDYSDSAKDAYFIVDGSTNPSGVGFRSFGGSVRCIAR